MAQLRKLYHRSGIALAAVVAIILFGAAGTASAQLSFCDASTEGSCMDHDFTGSQFNNCNGDLVTFTGHYHTVNNSNSNSNFVFLKFQSQWQGNGVGDPSGRQYTVGNSVKVHSKFDAAAFTEGPVIFRATERVISHGSSELPDNWFLTTAIHVNGQGQVTKSIVEESRCSG